MRQRTDMLPPRLRVAIERSPELKEFMGNTPVEELRHLLMEGDVQVTSAKCLWNWLMTHYLWIWEIIRSQYA